MKPFRTLLTVLALGCILILTSGFNPSQSREIEKLGGNPLVMTMPPIVGQTFDEVKEQLGPAEKAGTCSLLTSIGGRRGSIPGDVYAWEHKVDNHSQNESSHFFLAACIYKGHVVGEERAFSIRKGKVYTKGQSMITDRGLAEKLIGEHIGPKETVDFSGEEVEI